MVVICSNKLTLLSPTHSTMHGPFEFGMSLPFVTCYNMNKKKVKNARFESLSMRKE